MTRNSRRPKLEICPSCGEPARWLHECEEDNGDDVIRMVTEERQERRREQSYLPRYQWEVDGE